jgi:hypothetical protein
MIETRTQQLARCDEAYLAAMALYEVLSSMQNLRVKRAEMRQGEVAAEPIDFLCDVDIKAARALQDDVYAYAYWLNVLADPSSYERMPEAIRQTLGRAFLENNMGVDGAYKALYFRTKNQADREALTEETECLNGGE